MTFTFTKASFRDSKILDLRVVSIYTEKEPYFTNHFDLYATVFPFDVKTMPVRKEIALGETTEISCLLKSEGDFSETLYTIRYFQPEGEGELRLNGVIFEPNDRYPLENKSFRLYYTSRSTDRQLIDIYIEDNHGQLQHLSFNFNNKRIE